MNKKYDNNNIIIASRAYFLQYLALKIPGPKGVITVKRSFEVSNTSDKEFNRMTKLSE
jgi:hypothetical protein